MDDLELRGVIVRIDRDIAEAAKLRAEQSKLFSEARKFDRERTLAPWLAVLGLLGGIITVAGALWRALHG
jgi:hypothetical protein